MVSGYVSTAKQTDPELIEVFDNFAFDEVMQYGNLDRKSVVSRKHRKCRITPLLTISIQKWNIIKADGAEIDKAYQNVLNGKVKFRYVIDMNTLKK